ncbi:unnamed protein product [Diamesa hyperborea]
MADDDSWLYGNNAEEQSNQAQVGKRTADESFNNGSQEEEENHPEFEEPGDDDQLPLEDSMKEKNEEEDTEKFEDNGSELDDSDDDEDDINVVIGDIKSGTQSYNIKTQPLDNKKIAGGKFNIEEFESVGTINGTAAHEFQIESIEDKPWRKPGADITDYFNYGFNEDTWRAYCERQKKMRVHESGIGLAGLTAAVNNQSGNPEGHHRHGISIGIRRPGPPRKPVGSIDVIGGGGGGSHPPRRDMNDMGMGMIRPPTPRENVIQVMTADRREYSRTVVGNNNPNMPPPPMQMQFNVPPEEYYNHEADNAFNYGYEPTQDSQWDPQNSNPGWAPGVKELTGISRPPPMIPPPMGMQQLRMPMGMPPMMQQQGDGPPIIPPLMGQMSQIPPKMVPQPLMSSSDKSRDKDREKNDDSRRRSDYEERRKMRERSSSKDREKDRQSTRKPERDSRYRDSSSRRDTRKERSRSREKSRRRSREKSRDKDKDRKDRRDKKSKSHKKDKDESE